MVTHKKKPFAQIKMYDSKMMTHKTIFYAN